MIIIDKPYVSNFLIETIRKNKLAVLKNDYSRMCSNEIAPYLMSEKPFISKYQASKTPKLYTASENSIGWIFANAEFSDLAEKINLFKNKIKFRALTSPMYPDFYYQGVKISDLEHISFEELPVPFIIKPATGFFSMGVYKVHNESEWEQTKKDILIEMRKVRNLYPNEVLNPDSFIIEECIEGEEFAFDAYYDEHGTPVLLNAFKHYFASENDVSDRVYYTSKRIIEEYAPIFTDFLSEIGALAKVRNFPVHVEVRIDRDGRPVPIEINALRFGGWCSTADMTSHAFDFNPYECFLKGQKPDWKSILSRTNDSLYSVIVLDNSTGQDGKIIKAFNYDLLCSGFANLLELRKVDYKEYPVFGFIFAEIKRDAFDEIEKISASNLREYTILHDGD